MRENKKSLKGGSMETAGESNNWPGTGPGRAGRKKAGMGADAYPSRSTPGNPGRISVYQEGDSPPKGFRRG